MEKAKILTRQHEDGVNLQPSAYPMDQCCEMFWARVSPSSCLDLLIITCINVWLLICPRI